MNPIEFPQQNSEYIDDRCNKLPTFKTINKQFGADEITSCWELDNEDIIHMLKQIKEGIRPVVYVSVIGGQPPIRLFCDN